MNKLSELIERIKNYIPIISLIVISLGYFRLDSIYNYYSIDIIKYLNFTEIILLSIKYILWAIFLLVILMLFYFYFLQNINSKIKHKFLEKKENINKEKRIFIRIIKRFILIWPITLLTYTLCIIFFCIYPWINEPWLLRQLTYILILIFFPFLNIYILYDEILFYYKNDVHSILKYIIIFYSIGIFLAKYQGEYSAYMNHIKPTIEVSLETEKLLVEYGQGYIYLGETQQYIFLLKGGSTLVINKANINFLSYKKI